MEKDKITKICDEIYNNYKKTINLINEYKEQFAKQDVEGIEFKSKEEITNEDI